MAQNSAEVGMRCIKYMLLTITLMFILTASLVISVGTTIFAIYHDFSFFVESHYFSPASLLIVIGVVMLFVSLFGCIGALKESTCMINTFGLILSLVFILEISAAIAAYKLQHGVADLVSERMTYGMSLYNEDEEIQGAVDFVQSRLSCCGISSKNDWYNVDHDLLSNFVEVDNVTAPDTCCAAYSYDTDTENENCIRFYSSGCLNRVIYLISQSAVLLGTGAMTIAFIQTIGIVFSLLLGKAIRRAKTERERRKWEIREQMINAYSALNPIQEKKLESIKPVVYVPTVGQTTA